MAARYMTLLNGARKLIEALATSTGVADAGKIVATGPDGRLDESLMPLGIGADTVTAPASEALGAGKFVNFHDDAGTFSVRLADNSNGRRADGFVIEAVAEAGAATVYPLDGVNSALTGLTPGARYYLGTAGGVTDTPLVETDPLNANKVSQYVGTAKSATELVTDDSDPVTL
ncbi:hypothetical protein DN824_20455 [Stutzerimonas nosocomialis]|uniref:hypothetical protein n=1 Tax=Stutzerimonas nosocomialis TaxID=1056496 RepID=UPI0011096B1E|nr:hypothetical protein [Stutzerimonas nosocomialis]TLX54857.1 hypothetical protein DN824_20455 [Stutzerimonas nosocomialis]